MRGFLLPALLVPSLGFSPRCHVPNFSTSYTVISRRATATIDGRVALLGSSAAPPSYVSARRKRSAVRMANDSNEGQGLVTSAIIVAILVVFVGSSLAPMFDMATSPVSSSSDLNLGNAVVTKQDSTKLKTYENKFDRLSRSKIQEKLNRIPVFYVTLGDDGASMSEKIYLSFDDASKAAKDDPSSVVKCTTLDQVMYPLVLKRGRMRMSTPPKEVQKAEETEGLSFKLVPSSAALKDAEESRLELADGDVPLFVADRLAFASNEGPQVPLFLEKADCITSYNRLRESGGNRLPEPTIRTATLMDELDSMERGTRPGVSQLQFYATAGDLLRASELLQ